MSAAAEGIESVSAAIPPDSSYLEGEGVEERDPYELFEECVAEARAAGHVEPTGMAVCAVEVDPTGARPPTPSCRVVLCRGHDAEGLLFYTNGESAKSRAFKSCSQVAATFWWERVGRQVRWTGTIEPATEAESDAYWGRRHPGHKRGAWASQQSQPLDSRAALQKKMDEVTKRFPDDDAIPRPPHWHGWRIKPTHVEFWQQRTNRLHDRLLFTRAANGRWTSQRLQP